MLPYLLALSLALGLSASPTIPLGGGDRSIPIEASAVIVVAQSRGDFDVVACMTKTVAVVLCAVAIGVAGALCFNATPPSEADGGPDGARGAGADSLLGTPVVGVEGTPSLDDLRAIAEAYEVQTVVLVEPSQERRGVGLAVGTSRRFGISTLTLADGRAVWSGDGWGRTVSWVAEEAMDAHLAALLIRPDR